MTRSAARPLACLLLLALAPTAARADEKSEAEAAMAQANEFLQRREYDAAIARFRDALRYAPTASGPFLGLGLAYAATDRCDRAIEALEEYLHRRTRDPKPEAKAELDACRARMNAPGELHVETAPPGAEVRLDSDAGAPAGITPYDARGLPRGPHKVYLRRTGFKPYVAMVRVEPGVLATVSVPLEPLEVIAVPLPSKPPIDDNLLTPSLPAASAPTPSAPPAPSSPPPTVAPSTVMVAPSPSQVAPASRAAPEESRLTVVASVSPASIYINGERVARDGRADLQLSPGLYGITVEREGFLGAAGSVTLGTGDRRAYTAELRPLKRRAGMSVGALFTVLAIAAEGAAIAGHVLADRSVNGTSDFQTFHQLELYGQVGAGSAAGVALVSFLVDYLINRGHVDEGVPFPLTPVAGERR